MRPHADYLSLSPNEQLRELARILAAGLLRLRRPILPSDSKSLPNPNNPPNSSLNSLEIPGKTRLSGPTG
jgi:hypothetical protein